MAKFAVVKEIPKILEKGEYVITQPDFMEQIELNNRKAPKHKQTATHHLREILNSIAEKYDHDMNPLNVKLVNYIGLPFKDNNDVSAIIVRLLKEEYPVVFNKVIAYQLKNRPMNTKLVYYVGDFSSTTAFYEAGLDLIDQKDIEAYMTGKPKKIVGKPAISNEEMETKNESNE